MDQTDTGQHMQDGNSSCKHQLHENSPPARMKRARSPGADAEVKEPPTSVPKFAGSTSVQQALDVLLAHGLNPAQLDLMRSQTVVGNSRTTKDSPSYDHRQSSHPLQPKLNLSGYRTTSQNSTLPGQSVYNSSLTTDWAHPAGGPTKHVEVPLAAKEKESRATLKDGRGDYESDGSTSRVRIYSSVPPRP
jgi:hypothetical protein